MDFDFELCKQIQARLERMDARMDRIISTCTRMESRLDYMMVTIDRSSEIRSDAKKQAAIVSLVEVAEPRNSDLSTGKRTEHRRSNFPQKVCPNQRDSDDFSFKKSVEHLVCVPQVDAWVESTIPEGAITQRKKRNHVVSKYHKARKRKPKKKPQATSISPQEMKRTVVRHGNRLRISLTGLFDRFQNTFDHRNDIHGNVRRAKSWINYDLVSERVDGEKDDMGLLEAERYDLVQNRLRIEDRKLTHDELLAECDSWRNQQESQGGSRRHTNLALKEKSGFSNEKPDIQPAIDSLYEENMLTTELARCCTEETRTWIIRFEENLCKHNVPEFEWLQYTYQTLLHHAVLCGNEAAVRVLLKCGTDLETPIKTSRDIEVRPIHLAARYGSVGIIQELVSFGCDINSKTDVGNTALLVSTKQKHSVCVKVLALAGADFGLLNKSGDSTVSVAEASKWSLGLERVILELIRFGVAPHSSNASVFSPFLNVAQAGDAETLKCLVIAPEIFLDYQDEESFTAAMLAAMKGDVKAVELLSGRGYSIDIADRDGYTPLMLAAREGHGSMCEFLISRGASCNARNGRGETLLDHSLVNCAVVIKSLQLSNLLILYKEYEMVLSEASNNIDGVLPHDKEKMNLRIVEEDAKVGKKSLSRYSMVKLVTVMEDHRVRWIHFGVIYLSDREDIELETVFECQRVQVMILQHRSHKFRMSLEAFEVMVAWYQEIISTTAGNRVSQPLLIISENNITIPFFLNRHYKQTDRVNIDMYHSKIFSHQLTQRRLLHLEDKVGLSEVCDIICIRLFCVMKGRFTRYIRHNLVLKKEKWVTVRGKEGDIKGTNKKEYMFLSHKKILVEVNGTSRELKDQGGKDIRKRNSAKEISVASSTKEEHLHIYSRVSREAANESLSTQLMGSWKIYKEIILVFKFRNFSPEKKRSITSLKVKEEQDKEKISKTLMSMKSTTTVKRCKTLEIVAAGLFAWFGDQALRRERNENDMSVNIDMTFKGLYQEERYYKQSYSSNHTHVTLLINGWKLHKEPLSYWIILHNASLTCQGVGKIKAMARHSQWQVLILKFEDKDVEDNNLFLWGLISVEGKVNPTFVVSYVVWEQVWELLNLRPSWLRLYYGEREPSPVMKKVVTIEVGWNSTANYQEDLNGGLKRNVTELIRFVRESQHAYALSESSSVINSTFQFLPP